jgi:hypothetical protein
MGLLAIQFRPCLGRGLYGVQESVEMRIWDFSVEYLCNTHLKAEHAELHCIWSVIVNGKRGYAKHPETMRWRDCLRALYTRHWQQEHEMRKRGIKHDSELDRKSATGHPHVAELVDSYSEQLRLLAQKKREGRCSLRPCIDRLTEAHYA